MKRLVMVVATALSVTAAPLLTAAAQAQQAPPGATEMPSGTEVSGRRIVRGTVTRVDTKTDEVSVKTDDGRQMTFAVDPSTAQRLKKGDQIEVGVQVKLTRPSKAE